MNLNFPRFFRLLLVCGAWLPCALSAVETAPMPDARKLSVGVAAEAALPRGNYDIIPLPREVRLLRGTPDFRIDAQTVLVCGKDKAAQRNARFLQQYLRDRTGLTLPIQKKAPSAKAIVLSRVARDLSPEGYRLTVDERRITIEGATDAGIFYGIQTLRKALPALSAAERAQGTAIALPAAVVDDAPAFAYRGAHLDVARHAFSLDSIRRFIDLLALHNINRFHWHLTDDQGWRIEIKKYPRLTTVGSRRAGTVVGAHNSGVYDGVPYGMFYSQRDCRDIVRYAAERHITVIPEIDLPGHMMGALAAYPHLGCTGGPYEVWKTWGVSEDVLCAGNPEVYRFIDDVLDEVVRIFPSEYIHVGGDECPKTRWSACPRCQTFIRDHHLEGDGRHSAEERLQSYVIRHAADHLAQRGRKIIGWDETLEGGLAPGATVMSWRGVEGGYEAARQGHDAIMTPTSYCYFDYYQTKNTRNEPPAFGGYVPVERVLSFRPIAQGMPEAEARHVIGVQANLWTERIPNFRHVEYMALPRYSALSEVAWRPSAAPRDTTAFLHRLRRMVRLYDEQGYNYARHIFDVHAAFHPLPGQGIRVQLSTLDSAEVHYTLDGTLPTTSSPRYGAPFVIKADARFRAAAFRPVPQNPTAALVRGAVEEEDVYFSRATTRPIELLQGVSAQYPFGGGATLVDGLRAADTNHQSGRWVGFYRKPLEAVIDLGEVAEVSSVNFRACVEKGSWIYGPRRIEVAVSTDGHTFTTVHTEDFPAMTEQTPNGVTPYRQSFTPVSARFVRLLAEPENAIPAWHKGAAGHPAFLFVDEVEVQ